MLFKKYLITKENKFERIISKSACSDCKYTPTMGQHCIYRYYIDCLCGLTIVFKIRHNVDNIDLYTHTYRAL